MTDSSPTRAHTSGRTRAGIAVATVTALAGSAVAALTLTQSFTQSADAAPRTGGSLQVAVGAAKPGGKVVAKGTLRTKVARPVVLQRSSGGAWVTAAKGRSTAKGRFTVRTKLPRTSVRQVRFRVLAPKVKVRGKKYPALRTPVRTVRMKPAATPTAAPTSGPPTTAPTSTTPTSASPSASSTLGPDGITTVRPATNPSGTATPGQTRSEDPTEPADLVAATGRISTDAQVLAAGGRHALTTAPWDENTKGLSPVVLHNLVTGARTPLVHNTPVDPNVSGTDQPIAVAADGSWAVFQTVTSVPGDPTSPRTMKWTAATGAVPAPFQIDRGFVSTGISTMYTSPNGRYLLTSRDTVHYGGVFETLLLDLEQGDGTNLLPPALRTKHYDGVADDGVTLVETQYVSEGRRDLLLRNRITGAATSILTANTVGAPESWNLRVSRSPISGDGTSVVFETSAPLLTGGPHRSYLYDVPTGTLRGFRAMQEPAISADGRYIGYQNPNPDYPDWETLFRYDRQTNTSLLVAKWADVEGLQITDQGRAMRFNSNYDGLMAEGRGPVGVWWQ